MGFVNNDRRGELVAPATPIRASYSARELLTADAIWRLINAWTPVWIDQFRSSSRANWPDSIVTVRRFEKDEYQAEIRGKKRGNDKGICAQHPLFIGKISSIVNPSAASKNYVAPIPLLRLGMAR